MESPEKDEMVSGSATSINESIAINKRRSTMTVNFTVPDKLHRITIPSAILKEKNLLTAATIASPQDETPFSTDKAEKSLAQKSEVRTSLCLLMPSPYERIPVLPSMIETGRKKKEKLLSNESTAYRSWIR